MAKVSLELKGVELGLKSKYLKRAASETTALVDDQSGWVYVAGRSYPMQDVLRLIGAADDLRRLAKEIDAKLPADNESDKPSSDKPATAKGSRGKRKVTAEEAAFASALQETMAKIAASLGVVAPQDKK